MGPKINFHCILINKFSKNFQKSTKIVSRRLRCSEPVFGAISPKKRKHLLLLPQRENLKATRDNRPEQSFQTRGWNKQRFKLLRKNNKGEKERDE